MEHLYEQLYGNDKIETITSPPIEIPKPNEKTNILPLGLEEVVQSIQKSKRNKASVSDNLPAEILQSSKNLQHELRLQTHTLWIKLRTN